MDVELVVDVWELLLRCDLIELEAPPQAVAERRLAGQRPHASARQDGAWRRGGRSSVLTWRRLRFSPSWSPCSDHRVSRR